MTTALTDVSGCSVPVARDVSGAAVSAAVSRMICSRLLLSARRLRERCDAEIPRVSVTIEQHARGELPLGVEHAFDLAHLVDCRRSVQLTQQLLFDGIPADAVLGERA